MAQNKEISLVMAERYSRCEDNSLKLLSTCPEYVLFSKFNENAENFGAMTGYHKSLDGLVEEIRDYGTLRQFEIDRITTLGASRFEVKGNPTLFYPACPEDLRRLYGYLNAKKSGVLVK